ncbi:MAG: Amuc_1100 family pilus-like protein [Verrucomicrobiales bacterium]|jgi:hypothetical protein|nr:Amuc_1100 family pilus-like protein [Verrucomicrobiales bacterium]MEC7357321.1 Amuc_1100 family pilus-like protein [Verrucomicrobiota bacterium]
MKNNSFLKIYSAIMIGGTLLLGFLVFKGRSSYNELTTTFENTDRAVKNLEARKIFPNESNLEEKKERVTSYVGAVDKLKAKVLEGQPVLNEDLTEQDFRQFMNQETEAIVAMAAKNKLILPENFSFGLDAYKQGKPFLKGALGRLEWQLNAAKQFIKIAADSGLDSIDEFNRDEFQEENVAAESKEEKGPRGRRQQKPPNRSGSTANPMVGADKVMETYRFTTEISSSYEALTSFLNGLASDGTSFLWVRKIRIENLEQESPRVGQINLPVPPEGVVPDDEGNTPMIDAAVLFGNEKMRARIVIDAVRFKGELAVSEDKKTASSQ